MKALISDNQINGRQDREALFRMLDRGIDDMEEGRELPLNEAFQKISELRDTRRNGRV